MGNLEEGLAEHPVLIVLMALGIGIPSVVAILIQVLGIGR